MSETDNRLPQQPDQTPAEEPEPSEQKTQPEHHHHHSSGSAEHEHHHHHHHHRSSPPVHALHKVQRKIRHMKKHMKKWQIAAALVCLAALAVFAGISVQRYQERKRTEAENAAWLAANGLDGNGTDGTGGLDGNGANGPGGPQNDSGTEIDYGPLSNNNFTDQLALRRPQLFANKEVLYNGQHYTRNTAVKAILLMGLDRNADDLQQIRPELWEQGQTDMLLLIAHNTFRNTVEILQIPRDTMAAMKAVTEDGQRLSDSVEQITLAFSYGDGVYKSCELTCDAVSRLLGGLEIEHYMLGDLRIVNTMNDLVGGVTVTIPDDGTNWKDPEFVKGKKVTLHGKQAEHFVRSRDMEYQFSSLVRMEHQKIFLQGFQTQVKRRIKDDPDFLDEMFDAVQTDMLSDLNRKEYVKLAGSMLNTAQLHDQDFLMLPGEAQMGEVYVEYIPHYADINEMILEMFYRKKD